MVGTTKTNTMYVVQGVIPVKVTEVSEVSVKLVKSNPGLDPDLART